MLRRPFQRPRKSSVWPSSFAGHSMKILVVVLVSLLGLSVIFVLLYDLIHPDIDLSSLYTNIPSILQEAAKEKSEAISLPNIVESAHQADKVIKLDQTIVTSTAISLQKDIHPTMMPSGVPTMISKVQTVSADRITCSEMQAKFGIVIGETWGSLTDSALRKHWQDMRCDEKVRQPLIEKASSGKGASSDKSQDTYTVCKQLQGKYHVVPEQSWGSMRNADTQNRWKSLECNTAIKMGKSVSCDTVNGLEFITDWRRNKQSICGGSTSLVRASDESYCYVSIRENIQCVLHSFQLDFNRIGPALDSDAQKNVENYIQNLRNESQKGKLSYQKLDAVRHSLPQSRSFTNGFAALQSQCPRGSSSFRYSSTLSTYVPGFTMSPSPDAKCDVIVSDAAIIISHDSLLNIGHMFEDILNVWLTVLLNRGQDINQIHTKDIILINIDGMRPGNILKGAGRHILDTLYIDSLGPFQKIYEVLFKRTISAAQEWGAIKGHQNRPGKRVCFTNEVLLYPMPLKAFLWDKFEVVDPCSLQLQPNPIYRSFVSTYMAHWLQYGNLARNILDINHSSKIAQYSSLLKSRLRVLLITRKQTTSASTNEIRARAFSNTDEIIQFIRRDYVDQPVAIGNKQNQVALDLLVADFSDLSFEHQVALAHSVDVLIGFHGAGMNHFFHMNYSRPNCCGVIEIFPQASGCESHDKMVCTYHRRKAHGNHARYLGYQYIQLTAQPRSLTSTGTRIEPNDLGEALKTILQSSSLILHESV